MFRLLYLVYILQLWVHNPRFDYQLPTFGHCPPQLGYLKPYDSSNEPDWNSFADIDDTRPIEIKFEIPDVNFDLCVVGAMQLAKVQVSSNSLPVPPSPFAIVYFNEIEVGHTCFRYNCCDPMWRDAIPLKLVMPSSMEINACRLMIEVGS